VPNFLEIFLIRFCSARDFIFHIEKAACSVGNRNEKMNTQLVTRIWLPNDSSFRQIRDCLLRFFVDSSAASSICYLNRLCPIEKSFRYRVTVSRKISREKFDSESSFKYTCNLRSENPMTS
jgi:hypothetical protein